MNVLKNIENIIKVRYELQEIEDKVKHLQREIDSNAAEIIEFLKRKEIIGVKK